MTLIFAVLESSLRVLWRQLLRQICYELLDSFHPVLDSTNVTGDILHFLLILSYQFVNLAFKLLLLLVGFLAESTDRCLDIFFDR